MFIFEKKIAEKLHKPRRKETITELLKSSVKTLERFRHPRVSVSFGDPQSIITFPLRHPPHHQPTNLYVLFSRPADTTNLSHGRGKCGYAGLRLGAHLRQPLECPGLSREFWPQF